MRGICLPLERYEQMSIQLLQGIKDRPVKLSHPSLAYKTSRFTGVIYRHMSDSEVAAFLKDQSQHGWWHTKAVSLTNLQASSLNRVSSLAIVTACITLGKGIVNTFSFSALRALEVLLSSVLNYAKVRHICTSAQMAKSGVSRDMTGYLGNGLLWGNSSKLSLQSTMTW
jgi:rhamnogalacturonyl hydrolase YesR